MTNEAKIEMGCFIHCDSCGRHTRDAGTLAMFMAAEGPCIICWDCYSAQPEQRRLEHARSIIARDFEGVPAWRDTETWPPWPAAQDMSDLEKHLVKLAEESRGLDHAALKRLYDEHEVVWAVWPGKRARPAWVVGMLKGSEYLLAQTKLGASGATAISCADSEHAKLLQQTFMSPP